MITGALIAGEMGWLTADTCAILVSLGGWAIASRRTKARELDLQQTIVNALIHRRPEPPESTNRAPFGPRRKD